MPTLSGETVGTNGDKAKADAAAESEHDYPPLPTADGSFLLVSSAGLQAAQEADLTLRQRYRKVVSSDQARGEQEYYFIDDGILLCRWLPKARRCDEWEFVNQIVVPLAYHQPIHVNSP